MRRRRRGDAEPAFNETRSEAQAGGRVWGERARERGSAAAARPPLLPLQPQPQPGRPRDSEPPGRPEAGGARGPVCSADFWSLYRLEK